MHVDHHNPTLPEGTRNDYENLFLASSHCNGKKSDRWPTDAQQALGIRFLNPCLEQDYGSYLFEDPDNFEIWSDTPAGKYHIRYLDLNAPHLVRERRARHALITLKEEPSLVTPQSSDAEAHEGAKAFLEELALMIPPIAQRRSPAKAVPPAPSVPPTRIV